MADAFIVSARRTAGGRRDGALAQWHPADLAAQTLNAVVADAGIDGTAIDDVVMGCVFKAGEQALQIGRTAVLASDLPTSVPATTVDRACGSSQQAIQFAAQAIMSGTQDVVIAAGVESMTRCPMGIDWRAGEVFDIPSNPFPASVQENHGISEYNQFLAAEMIAKKWGHTKEQVDAFSVQSHQKAAAARDAGAFVSEIVQLDGIDRKGDPKLHQHDEGIRDDASVEAMTELKILMDGGIMTAANASQICDGSAALLIVSEQALKDHNLMPMARIDNVTVTAGDPVIMLEEPLGATDKALERSGRKIGDMDLYEVNEAFAPVPLAWLEHTGADPDRLNVNGGAIALGHPLGCSGAKLMTTLVHSLHAKNRKWGLLTMCEGGGMANVTIVEAL